MKNQTNIENALVSDDEIDLYLSHVTNAQFKKDVKELIAAYSDQGAIDRAIAFLQSIKAEVGEL